MENLPTTWALVPLGQLGDWGSGGTPKRTNAAYYENGTIPWLKIGDLTDGPVWVAETCITENGLGNSSAKLLEPETILVAMYGSIGKLGITKIQCATNQAIAFCYQFDELINRDFLFRGLQYLKPTLVSLGQGGTQQNISQTLLKNVELPLAPFNEQHRIVDKIDTLFAQLDQGEVALRKVQALLARYRQSVLQAAVTGQLTADWRARNAHRLESGQDLLARILEARRQNWQGRGKYKEPVAPDAKGLPDLPEGWIWATLPMLGDFGRGKSKHRPRNDPKLYENGKYPFLQTGRVRNSNGRISDYDALYNETGLAQSRLWPRGTVCITIAANIAETGILDIDACFPDSVVGLIPEAEISGEYVEYFIRTAKDELDRYAPATAQKNINLAILEEVAVPLPSFEEQEEIVRHIDDLFAVAEAVEIACESELTRSAALRQSILKDAFAGKLVPQDPADEPASALLARIRAEREARQ